MRAVLEAAGPSDEAFTLLTCDTVIVMSSFKFKLNPGNIFGMILGAVVLCLLGWSIYHQVAVEKAPVGLYPENKK